MQDSVSNSPIPLAESDLVDNNGGQGQYEYEKVIRFMHVQGFVVGSFETVMDLGSPRFPTCWPRWRHS